MLNGSNGMRGGGLRACLNNQNFIRGVFIMGIALLFGIASLRYPIGSFSRGGPGLFPLMASCTLFAIGAISTVYSFFAEPEPMSHSVKNISIIMLSLIGCAAISGLINMIVGIIFLVFFSSLAATSYSTIRNVKVSAGLIAVAFGFKNLLGLSLPLY